MKYIIDVTKEDIEAGKPREATSCPIALAATRAVGHQMYMGSSLLHSGDMQWFFVSPEVSGWIHDFDAGRDVEPISFEVDLVPASEARYGWGSK